MLDEIQEYLSGVESPERVELLLEACQIIVDLGIVTHLDDIQQILAAADNSATVETQARIDNTLHATLEACLNQFGVFVNPETASLRIKTALLRGLHLITNYEDTDAVDALCQSDESAEDVLANLMELVTEYQWGDFLIALERVSPILIQRIPENLLRSEDVEETEDQVDTGPIQTRLKTLLSLVGDLYIVEVLDSGVKLGSDVSVLMTHLHNYLDQMVESQGRMVWLPTTATAELLGFVLASNTPDEQVLEVAQIELENLFENDINFLTKASVELSRWISKVQASHEKA